MNPTSRAIFQSVVSSDATLTGSERAVLERLLRGESAALTAVAPCADEQLLLSQKKAAKLLDVSRVTVWRMTKECVLHPVEILPGTWRYSYGELAALAQLGEPKNSDETAAVPRPRRAVA
jgi:hypothetical protein